MILKLIRPTKFDSKPVTFLTGVNNQFIPNTAS